VDVRAQRFPLLDSLRAIAALSVLTLHGAFQHVLVFYPDSTLTPYASRLGVGVTIFFVISGFLLYRPFAAARLAGERAPSTGAYAWRRFLRIVPAYWVALTIAALVVGLSYVFTLDGVLRFYGFAQIYSSADAVNGLGQAWTLCVEVAFYALLPLWALGQRRLGGADPRARLRRELAGLGVLALIGLAYATVVVVRFNPNLPREAWMFLQLPNFLDAFAAGMALAVLSAWWQGAQRPPAVVRAVERRPWIPWLVALAAFATCAQLGTVGALTDTEYFVGQRLFVVVAVGLLLPAVFGDPARGWVRRLLARRWLLWVGLVSYGVYLWHPFVYERLIAWGWLPRDTGGQIARFAAGLALTLAIAAVSYYVVERPVLKLKRRVAGSPAPDQPGAVSAPAVPVLPGGQPAEP
jgi:peptidoglycan/LPS O-acetylase OafA/YrhL